MAFGLDWNRPSRQVNGTSFFYNHTSQWRHEKLAINEVASQNSLSEFEGMALIDCNAKAERMGWLPSAPQLSMNPLTLTQNAIAQNKDPIDYAVEGLKSGAIDMSCNDPDNPANFPRNMFVWRSNILGSSGNQGKRSRRR